MSHCVLHMAGRNRLALLASCLRNFLNQICQFANHTFHVLYQCSQWGCQTFCRYVVKVSFFLVSDNSFFPLIPAFTKVSLRPFQLSLTAFTSFHLLSPTVSLRSFQLLPTAQLQSQCHMFQAFVMTELHSGTKFFCSGCYFSVRNHYPVLWHKLSFIMCKDSGIRHSDKVQ